MRITKVETFLTNSGLRNYLFLRLHTDTGLTGIGEASLEWQEKTVETLIHEWVVDRIMGADPTAVETLVGDLIRDQYQGGATVMTAISGVEVACWDLIGKSCGQPVYELLGGRCHDRLPAYANGWYGGARTPGEYAQKAREAKHLGYKGLKFDPFGTAWKTMAPHAMDEAEALMAAVRNAVGEQTDIMIEVHGRLDVPTAIAMGCRLEKYRPRWYEEPVTPNSLDQLQEVKQTLPLPIAAGERLYSLEEFERLVTLRAVDVVQMDPSHCGGLLVSKKIAAMAHKNKIMVSPHCSTGPVSLCAALHFDLSTPNVAIQENFAEYDVPWRNDLVFGWNPIRKGMFNLSGQPGLGIELNTQVCAEHPYQKNTFPSLWDEKWLKDFTRGTPMAVSDVEALARFKNAPNVKQPKPRQLSEAAVIARPPSSAMKRSSL